MNQSLLNDYFKVVASGQTYLNLIYLLLAFPLGTVYFVLLVTGISLGFGLLIILLGALILAAVVLFNWTIAVFERQLAVSLLQIEIAPLKLPSSGSPRMWERIRAYLIHPGTWTSLLFTFLKFPMGIFAFALSVSLLGTALGMTFAPFYYETADIHLWEMSVNSMEEAAALCVIGVLLFPGVLHILNFTAKAYGAVAQALLSPTNTN